MCNSGVRVQSEPVLKSWGIGFVRVKNYLAFHTISKENRAVYIVRFLYGKRDWVSVLKQDLHKESTA